MHLFDYIEQNLNNDVARLMLRHELNLPFDKRYAVMQIECRQRTKLKIPTLLAHRQFLFPKHISAEQCTHEDVARLHAEAFDATDSVLDMTMGLGVDTYFIAQKVQHVTAIEKDEEIAACGTKNMALLAPNVAVVQGDSVAYLQNSNQQFSAIFIDPARRGEGGERRYGLADCVPNVLQILPLIFAHTKRLYIKVSPMVDVTEMIKQIEASGCAVMQVWAVSVKNECKELLVVAESEQPHQVKLRAVNLGSGQPDFWVDEECPDPAPCVPLAAGNLLFEPNASVMKLGCFNALAARYGLAPIAKNSHLFVAATDSRQASPSHRFPGRVFHIDEVVPFKDKSAKTLAKNYPQMNVATRNFRLSAEALKKRLKISDGGDIYLFATTTQAGEQVLLRCSKV